MPGTSASGRKLKPAVLRILEGNPGKRPIKPEPVGRVPESWEPPLGLMPKERKVWRRVVKELTYMGIITAADTDALAMYCQAVAHAPETEPGTPEWDRTLKLIRSFASEFGMTPASRSRLSVPDKRPEGASDLD